jgi:nitrite reductase (cytochrome c-552)
MPSPMPKQQQRLLTCGQCHSTYVIPKQAGKSVDVVYPWGEGKVGDISVESIIKWIRGNEPRSLEFTQTLTGLKLGYIRHPEYELFSRQGVHYRAGVACPDCHMPYEVQDDAKVTNHTVSDPFDDPDLKACRRCHPNWTADQLRATVYGIQDRTVGLILTAGYSTAQAGRLFQILRSTPGSASVPATTLAAAKEAYEEAFYRVAFIGAENSVGFHNPDEADRIAADGLAWAQRCEGILRQELGRLGVKQPPEVDLNLLSYMEQRGKKKLVFDPNLMFSDPSGNAERLFSRNIAVLRSVTASESAPPLAPTQPLPTP